MKTSYNNFSFNTSVFYIDWTDKQVNVLKSANNYVVENAGKAQSYGFEVDFTAHPVKRLTVSGGFGFSKATYINYKPDALSSYRGKYITDYPAYTLNLGAIYSFDSGFTAGLFANRYGKIYFDQENTVSQKEYVIVDMKVGYVSEIFDVSLYCDNVFNESYRTKALQDLYTGKWYGRPGAPPHCGYFFNTKDLTINDKYDEYRLIWVF